jgi:hypothetical protein
VDSEHSTSDNISICNQKIELTKNYFKHKKVLHKMPTDREWWEKLVRLVNWEVILDRALNIPKEEK